MPLAWSASNAPEMSATRASAWTGASGPRERTSAARSAPGRRSVVRASSPSPLTGRSMMRIRFGWVMPRHRSSRERADSCIDSGKDTIRRTTSFPFRSRAGHHTRLGSFATRSPRVYPGNRGGLTVAMPHLTRWLGVIVVIHRHILGNLWCRSPVGCAHHGPFIILSTQSPDRAKDAEG